MNDFTQYKTALEHEQKELEEELSKLGIQNPQDPSGWSLKNPDLDILNADENEAADKNEELHINSIILDELAVRYSNVKLALEKIAANTFGTCEECEEPIETERLTANPAARTCKKHAADSDA